MITASLRIGPIPGGLLSSGKLRAPVVRRVMCIPGSMLRSDCWRNATLSSTAAEALPQPGRLFACNERDICIDPAALVACNATYTSSADEAG